MFLALQTPPPTYIRECLAISVPQSAIAVVRKDLVEAAILSGALKAPIEGQTIGQGTWRHVVADSDGFLPEGYVEANIRSTRDRIVLIEPAGASFFYVNGEPRIGDLYSTGYVSIPVHLRAGDNPMFFRGGRGRIRIRVIDDVKPLGIDNRDATLADSIAGKREVQSGALVVHNATDLSVGSLSIETQAPGGRVRRTRVPTLVAMSVYKASFQIDAPTGGKVEVRLLRQGKEVDRTSVSIRLRKPGETFKRTFISEIDGSVQYYGVNPARGPSDAKPALVLSLHGAGVEAMGQADAYSGKSWVTLVAPTNRRPYGYDWEDWGRIDALEVLDEAKRHFDYDPARVYLGGHSMGGHGAWQVGVLYPDLFAAIAPSAGWISSYSYAGARRVESPSPLEALLQRANSVGDTTSMAQNYASEGVYILHGGADDNVPVTEARTMAELLKGFHHDFVYHEEPGQGHWWNLSPEPGADCVDWAPMYDFYARHSLPQVRSVRDIDFSTANPGVSSKLRWASIEAQEVEGVISRLQIHVNPHVRAYTGTTTNVARFAVNLSPLYGAGEIGLTIDGQALKVPAPSKGDAIVMTKLNGKWRPIDSNAEPGKNPVRYGPFRLAFNHRMLLVYGTHGTPEENAWAVAKARYDSETFWLRGNASLEMEPDTAFDPKHSPDRDVILYGNVETNAAWSSLLGSSPLQVYGNRIDVGATAIPGNDLACLFLRPRPGSRTAFVAAVSGTGLAGMKATNNLPYLQPMIGFPDVLVLDHTSTEMGTEGIRAAGFFGLDWGVPSGDFVFVPRKSD